MNQSRAKQLRREAYPDEMSPGHRTYAKDANTGTVFADVRRRKYQNLKGRARDGVEPQVKNPKWKRYVRLVMPWWFRDRKLRKEKQKEEQKKEQLKPLKISKKDSLAMNVKDQIKMKIRRREA